MRAAACSMRCSAASPNGCSPKRRATCWRSRRRCDFFCFASRRPSAYGSLIVPGLDLRGSDMRASHRFGRHRAIGAVAATLALSAAAAAQPTDDADDKPGDAKRVSVEALLKSGWQVAGYASASNNRAFILFRHPNETISCSASPATT